MKCVQEFVLIIEKKKGKNNLKIEKGEKTYKKWITYNNRSILPESVKYIICWQHIKFKLL